MKTNSFILSILLLFLTCTVFTSCENDEEDLIENKVIPEIANEDDNAYNALGVDKDNERPGSQVDN
ncbi:hypothetical protein HN014_22165 (plasmid) [Aquimarina sp. TRL1]|uniref:hypothetical protein n=1 Tax=Aquimarina sp. (strain TRL1) TaxID=2736252 RepID=UPI00158BB058|nr:hypothetical protein [Aquimarina sp. TRL1]QKX07707.1 hypothetical protein HN014_22165 [Aquimarina sp. TRL1]